MKSPMPYADSAKDAERKRRARQARRPSPVDFGRWFRESVDDVPVIKAQKAWSTSLAEAMAWGEESDKTLRRYYNGEIERPRVAAAYRIGWGLHDLGLQWCSGPVGLLAAGHLSPFFEILALLSSGDEQTRCSCIRLAFASFTAIGFVPSGVPGKGWHQQMHLIREDARSAAALGAGQRDAIDAAWARRQQTGSLRKALPEFALALDIIDRSALSEKVRIYGALTIVARVVANSDREIENGIIEELEWLSPIATPPVPKNDEGSK